MAKCSVCGDTLRIQGTRVCERCHGIGEILEKNDFEEYEVHKCWRCKGTGRLQNGGLCPDRYKEGHPS